MHAFIHTYVHTYICIHTYIHIYIYISIYAAVNNRCAGAHAPRRLVVCFSSGAENAALAFAQQAGHGCVVKTNCEARLCAHRERLCQQRFLLGPTACTHLPAGAGSRKGEGRRGCASKATDTAWLSARRWRRGTFWAFSARISRRS